VRWINRTVFNLQVPPTDSSNNHGTAVASGEASRSARPSSSYRDYPAVFRSGYAVCSWNQTDSYRAPAIRMFGSLKSQNQGSEGTRRDNRLQIPDDLASQSEYGCFARLASSRDQGNWQEDRLMIFLPTESDRATVTPQATNGMQKRFFGEVTTRTS
jgi:hypothetical protein